MLMLDSSRRARISARARRLNRRVSRYNRWLVASLIGCALVVLTVLALVPLPKEISSSQEFFEGLDRSLLTAALLAFAAYFWFNFWITHWATRELLRVAQETPEQMFPHLPEGASSNQVFGREHLVKEMVRTLRLPKRRRWSRESAFGGGPLIVVGSTGSGKTTLLLALSAYLAKEHLVVPIVLSLRDRVNDLQENDFAKLAVERFGELVNPYIKTEAEADKLWRWMCKRNRLVILADDLDRSSQVNGQDPYRTQIRLALDAARRRNLPLVVTTRPSGLPPDLSEIPIDLSAVGLRGRKRAAEYVLRRAGRVGDSKAGELVESNIEQGDLLENAFYLTLLARLLRVGLLDEPAGGGRHAVRLGLLSADRARICGEGVLNKRDSDQREKALSDLEHLAVASLVPADESGFDSRWLSEVRHGEQFGLLSLDGRGRPQFKHEVLHAYYASRAIVGGAAWKERLKQKPTGARMQLTLVLAAAGGAGPDFCREACNRLLDEVEGLASDQHLLRATGAAELAKAGGFFDLDGEIAGRCLQKKAGASSVVKRAALEQLEKLGGSGAVDALWGYAQDDDYGTRWAAVECLVRRCSKKVGSGGEAIREPFKTDAYTIIDSKIVRALAEARELLELPKDRRLDDSDRRIVLLKQLAWMLPSLRTSAKDPDLHSRIDGHLQELLLLEREGVTSQRGLEASVAQGFKADALSRPEAPPDPYAMKMLRERAVFWYSQLNLVHALALRMARDPDCDADSLTSIIEEVRRRERVRIGALNGSGGNGNADLHPMLLYAAKLCKKELKGTGGEERLERMKEVVWRDEGTVVSARPRRLKRPAAQLVGELTVLLNLNETGSPEQRRVFGEGTTLPHCLHGSRRRREFQQGCHDDCGFDLCPFEPARDEPSAHRELSRAFCRDQRLKASFRIAKGWGSGAIPFTLAEFWSRLESRARF